MRHEIVSEISVCSDCMHEHANGEHSPDRPADLPEVWSVIGLGYFATMGGEHSEHCMPDNRDAGCECDDLGFTQSSCEACGDHHHGDRYRFTLWRATLEHARESHCEAIGAAREADTVSARTLALTAAAEWRGYLADRFAADRRFERMMTRYRTAA